MIDFPLDWTAERIRAFMAQNNFQNVRQLEDGSWAGTIRLMFTTAICTGVSLQDAFAYRYCYEDKALAVSELAKLKAYDDEPSGYKATRFGYGPYRELKNASEDEKEKHRVETESAMRFYAGMQKEFGKR